MTYLDRVNSPADVKKMTAEELKGLAADIREGILKRDSLIGGHVGPNLGFVEATLALHYVFNSPEDKIVYDVSHQCYAHKMITGRKNGFLNPDDYFRLYESARERARPFCHRAYVNVGQPGFGVGESARP